MGDMFKKPDNSAQESLLKKQEQDEKARLAESESEVARRKAMAGKSGQSMLTKTSPTGLSNNLAGK